MGWAKFDDRWATHPKLLAVGLEGKGLDASAICWSAGQETDGFIPDDALRILAVGNRSPHRVARNLVASGRWSRDDERRGYIIHDYLDYNPSKVQRDAEREAKQRAGSAGGTRSAATRSHSRTQAGASSRTQAGASPNGLAGASSSAEAESKHSGAPPSRPVPSPLSPSPLSKHEPPPHGSETEEKDEDQDQDTDPLVVRLASLWPGRERMRAECAYVVGLCRQVADGRLIDEAIGAMLTVDAKPHTPKYLLATVRNKLVQCGAYAESDPALKVLSARPEAGAA